MDETKYIQELTDEFLDFYNSFSSWESKVIKGSKLTVSETHAIEILGKHGKMNMKSLAKKLGVATSTITVTVDRLQKGEYARRESADEDRRVHLINLTDKGRKVYEEHHEYHTKLTEKITTTLSIKECKDLYKTLKKINNIFLK